MSAPQKTIQGVGGSCTLPAGFYAKLSEFSATLDLNSVDTTGFSDVGWVVHEATFMHFSGSAKGTMVYDAASSSPAPPTLMAATPALTTANGSITLTFFTGCTWTFNGHMSKIAVTRPTQGKADITYDFEHQGGGVVQVWDET